MAGNAQEYLGILINAQGYLGILRNAGKYSGILCNTQEYLGIWECLGMPSHTQVYSRKSCDNIVMLSNVWKQLGMISQVLEDSGTLRV